MDTVSRLNEIADARALTMFQLAQTCDVPYSTLSKTVARKGQLSLDTIERICLGLHMPLSAFFEETADYECVKNKEEK